MEDIPCSSRDADKLAQQLEYEKSKSCTGSYGGKNCCVPQCKNNSLKNPELSFHKIPKNCVLQTKWIKLLKTKGLCSISPHYRVCSVHFPGGKKTYTNNIPTLLTINQSQKPRRRISNNKCPLQAPLLENECNMTNPPAETTSRSEESSENLVAKLKEEVETLQSHCHSLEKKYEDVKATEKCLFRMERFVGSDSDFRFYTGFPDYTTFKLFFDYLSPACNNLIYYGSNTGIISSPNQKKHGKERSVPPEQELFMVLSRLRCGFLLQDLAHRYGMSSSHLSRIWITWTTFLHQQLRVLPIWPTREFVNENMPACFKHSFPSTRVIIDCTEMLIEMPSSCRSQSVTFSSYKHHNTAKGLLGISPNGYPSFVSSLYSGRTSDKKITNDCGILNLLEPGDQIMADRGFDIENDLPPGVTLNIPPFLKGKDQLSIEEETSTRKIASVRVHVERAIARIKTFRILHQVVPITIAKELDKIWTICSYITLFLPPLIEDKF